MFGGLIGYVVVAVAVVVAVSAGLAWKPLMRFRQKHEAAAAIASFRLQREQLEARFIDLASATGRPRGLRWIECDWQCDVQFARDIQSRLLTAFVAVNIRFEAIEGGDMEDVQAVSTIRDAAALFHYPPRSMGNGWSGAVQYESRERCQPAPQPV